ncbi:MAG: hypothetical protein ACW986_05935 [Promethearchaeota archaeon]
MRNISNTEEFENLKDQIKKNNQKINEQLKNLENHTNEQVNSLIKRFNQELEKKLSIFNNKIEGNFKTIKDDAENKYSTLNNQITDFKEDIEEKIQIIIDNIQTVSKDSLVRSQRIREDFDTKEEILRDMLKKIEEKITEFKNTLTPQLKNLKSEQDLVRITVDVLKKQIYDSAKEMISEEIRLACKNKEKEILMNLWVEELNEIIHDLDKLKNLHPKELKLHINEIFSIVDSYKAKFSK